MFYVAGKDGENEFIFTKLNEFRVDNDHGAKPTFQYRLAGVGLVCREAWIMCAGFPNRNNSRVRNLEAIIRRGETIEPRKTRKFTGLNSTTHAVAFLTDYVLKNSQRSPVSTDLYVYINFRLQMIT